SRTNSSMNFSVLCKHGTSAWLVLQPLEGDNSETVIALDPHFNRTGHYWHIRLEGLPDRFRYGWRGDGPTHERLRFDPSIVLLDPAATLLSGGNVWGQTCEPYPDHTERRSVFIVGPHYDWQDDAPPLISWEDSIIYELHVRGFTCHPSSGVKHPGT